MKLETGIAVTIATAVALYLFAVSFGWSLFSQEAAPTQSYVYSCGEFDVLFSLSDDMSVLYVDGVAEPLVFVASDSGTRYDNSLFSFVFSGDALTITNVRTNVVLGECVVVGT